MSERASAQRIVYFGSGAFGLPTLAALRERHTLLGIVTQPDRPAGRSRKATPTPVGLWAQEHAPALPVFKPENVNAPEIVAQIRALPADAFVVIAFGQKMGRELLRDRFAINLHASLLPRWRGAAPINHAILAGDGETGNSVITLADRMDAGEVLGQSRRPISPTVTAGELHDLLAADGPALVLDVLERRREGTLAPVAQDESKVTLAGKLSRADGAVDWALGAGACAGRINGLSPWPGVSARLGETQLKLVRAASAELDSGTRSAVVAEPGLSAPGTLIDPSVGLILCGGGTALRLIEVQPAGGKPMAWDAFARGRHPSRGDRLVGESGSC